VPQPARLDRTADDLAPPVMSTTPARAVAQTQTAIAVTSPSTSMIQEAAFFDRSEDAPLDETVPPVGVPSRRRGIAVVLVVAVAGLSAFVLAAAHFGVFQHKPQAPTKQEQLESLLQRANAALLARHYDAPPGDNVLELTASAIAIDAAEARIYQLRKSASGLLVDEALEAKSAHDYARALRELSLAQKLGDEGKGLDEEVEAIEAEAASDPKFVELVSDGGAGRFTASARVGDEGLPVRAGEPVTLHATISGGESAGDDPKAHFHLRGPGLDKPVVLDAKPDGNGGFTATYAFLRSGTFSVTFFARPDGFPVRAVVDARVVSRGAWPLPPRASATTSSTTTRTPTPAPSTSSPKTLTPSPTTTGTITLTPDPIPIPIPTTPTPAPLPTVP
jgi:hypothetical protein